MLDEIHDGDARTTVIDAELEGARIGALGLTGPERRRSVRIPVLLADHDLEGVLVPDAATV